MRVYVAGPMTGVPAHNFPAFNSAEERLMEVGLEVCNPARLGAGAAGMTWADYMRRDITDMLTCDGIALLPRWQGSRGAVLEAHIARSLELPVLPLDQWLEQSAGPP